MVDTLVETDSRSIGVLDSPAYDVRDILPESLQELCLHGFFDDDEWEDLKRVFDLPHPATPHLTGHGLHIQRHENSNRYSPTLEVYGRAPEPPSMLKRPVGLLLSGHGPT